MAREVHERGSGKIGPHPWQRRVRPIQTREHLRRNEVRPDLFAFRNGRGQRAHILVGERIGHQQGGPAESRSARWLQTASTRALGA